MLFYLLGLEVIRNNEIDPHGCTISCDYGSDIVKVAIAINMNPTKLMLMKEFGIDSSTIGKILLAGFPKEYVDHTFPLINENFESEYAENIRKNKAKNNIDETVINYKGYHIVLHFNKADKRWWIENINGFSTDQIKKNIDEKDLKNIEYHSKQFIRSKYDEIDVIKKYG